MIPKIRETVSGRRWERPLRNRGTGDLTISSLKKHVLALGAIVVLASSSRPTVVSAEGPEGRQILEVAGVPGGLVVHLGCGDGRLTAALRGSSAYVVHGLDVDPTNVDRARQTIREAGLYGPVSVERWTDFTRLPYAENLVNLLVAEDLGRVPMSEVLRVLAPCGVVCVGKNGQWTKTVKPWPAEMDEWTHWMHAPDGNPVSRDRLVGPPRQTQWIDGLPYSKKHWGPRTTALVTAGGRLFTIEDETPSTLFNVADRWVLIARDAFNGIVLWRRELPRWASGVWTATRKKDVAEPAPTGLLLGAYGEQTGAQGGREAMETMVATSRHLFVPLAADEPLSVLDAATGEVLRTFDGTPPPQQVLLTGSLLLIGSGQHIAAVAPETGLTKWQAPGKSLAAAGDRGHVLRAGGDKLACLSLQDGQTLWETAYAQAAQTLGVKKPAAGKAGFAGSLQVGTGVVLAPYRAGLKNSETMVLDAATGRPLWVLAYHDRPFGDGGGPFITEDGLVVFDSVSGEVRTLDTRTGQPKNTLAAPAIRYAGHHPRCYESRLTPRFIIGKQRGADFVDLASGKVTWCNWLRGSCHRGAIPANGLLYAGQHSCRCYTEAALRGLNALAPRSGEAAAAPRPDDPVRLERGPAFEALSSTESPAPSPDDWPTYRHDAARSGASPCALGDKLAPAWTAALSGRLTASVVSDGRLLVAAADQHAVHALDASSGKPLWCFTAGGRIDSPPTLHAGLALFGCHDGYVYCLRADTGALVWRFRAAPRERKVGAYGQIESAWPVPGSILVREGSDGQATAYCVAGRSSFLDGGMTVFGLDPRSGAVRCSRPLDGPWQDPAAGSTPDNPNRGFTMPGSLPDVMVAGAAFEQGRTGDGLVQPVSIMYRLAGVDEKQALVCGSEEEAHKVRVPKGTWCEVVTRGQKSGELASTIGVIRLYRASRPGERVVNATQVNGIDGTKVEDLTRAELEGRAQAYQVLDFVRKHAPGYEKAYVAAMPMTVGVRETRRILGVQYLTRDDCTSGRKWPDAVVRSASFPIDIHNPSGSGQAEGEGPQGRAARVKPYDIPYGCLVPRKIDGLLLAGRCISGSHDAHASYRVQCIAMAIGAAAGAAAATALKQDVLPRNVDVAQVQTALADEDRAGV